MGLFFRVEHANLVAYLTTTGRNPLRVSFGELHSFLVLLAGEGEEAPDQLFSSSSHWADKVKRAAVMGKKGLDEIQNWHEPVTEDEVETRLALLRSALSSYHLVRQRAHG